MIKSPTFHGSQPPRISEEKGLALVLVLFFLVILSGIIVAFFASVTTESASAHSYAAGASAKMLSDAVVNLVEAQIQDGTRTQSATNTILAWASQPGALRTFDTTGQPQKIYKLYSAEDLVVPATGFQSDITQLPPSWNTGAYEDVYTDLNAPEKDINNNLIYPIVDPTAIGSVDGFAINNPPGYSKNSIAGALNNPAPMPVKWLYLLQDGTLAAADATALPTISIPGATTANPIIGRVAFWTDDDTAKVNINTASEGVYWDTPRVFSLEDYGVRQGAASTNIGTPGMSLCQPAQHEYQRYPGHPATTSLSPVLGKFLPVPTSSAAITASTASQFDAYYKIAPRVAPGGSESGTQTASGAINVKQDRLYPSVDELMFSTQLTNGSRVPNTAAPAATKPNIITRQVLEKVKFFLTADSSAPETTLYNTPRISIWPVNSNATLRTGYDKLAAFCSTIGNQNYYFTRSNPRSSTADFSGRNPALYQYLQAVTSKSVPGFGGDFLTKYAADRDQILTSIFDYIRCTSIEDRSTGATPYTTPFIQPSVAGAGEVVPIKINNTQGFGRFYSISEADLLFWASPWGTGTGLNTMLVLEFASPMQGLGCMRSNLSYSVNGLEKLLVKFTTGNLTPLGFVANNGSNGTNFMDFADLDTYHGRSLGGTEGPAQAFLYSGGAKPYVPGAAAHNQYPFVTPPASPVPIPANSTTFQFQSSNPNDEVVIKIQTADTNQLIQTVHLKFPNGTFKVPTVGAPAPSSGTFGLVPAQATMVGLEPAGTFGNDPASATDPTAGDTRMIEGLADVPSIRFRAHRDYKTQGVQWAHGLITAVGVSFNGSTFGKLTGVSTYQQSNSYNNRQPDVPSRVGNAVMRADGRPGDWDTGIGDQKDGAYINKPDEGDSALTDSQNNELRLPYLFGYGHGFASATQTYFSPNRQVPSPLMFGSIPTGVQRFLPWQTLLFNPRPEDPTHPGRRSPPDHLIADLFWMPVIEPYAISQPFSTSGKINMNYQIQPFTYIQRSTGLYAVLKSTKFLALQLSDSTTYKPIDPGNGGVRTPNRRYPIDIAETLKAFDTVFSQNQIFKSATQICEMNLIPMGSTLQSIPGFWATHPLSGDNVREKPYVDIYPRLTTKSNTFTVHMRVQSLKKARGTPPDQWMHGKDQVCGDYRGSSTIERYIDVNDPQLPDFATLAVSSLSDPKLNIDQYYKIRIVSTRRFSPN